MLYCYNLGRSRQVSTLFLNKMKLYKYSEKDLREAVRNSTSMRQTLDKLCVSPFGGNYDVLRKALYHFAIDTSHFRGQAWKKGKSLPPKTSTEDYLSNKLPIQSYKLKRRLIKEGYFQHLCSKCGNTKWLNEPIPLELDHVNGDKKDNRLENLRLLCPNCHAFTPTYRSKNRSRT